MRIAVGMSGGVDSSLTAALVAEAGHEVVGVTMKLWPCAELDGGFTRTDACCSPTETIDARSVAQKVGARHYVVDFEDGFRRNVVDGFVADYARGLTPNPCVRCNETVKFGELWRWAASVGAERVATGHYARVERALDRWLLRTAVDAGKDQTYFLFSLTQEQLSRAEFPVGGLTKAEVREAARQRGLPTADKGESQDICFVNGSAADFVRAAAPDAFRPGDFVLVDGSTVGTHRGLPAYTIGQRHGLGIAWSEPLYVVRLDPARNQVVVGPREALETRTLPLTDLTWSPGQVPAEGIAVLARLRHRGRLIPARVLPRPGVGEGGLPNAEIHFDQPTARAAPGQACVLYDPTATWCWGGGWIVPDA